MFVRLPELGVVCSKNLETFLCRKDDTPKGTDREKRSFPRREAALRAVITRSRSRSTSRIAIRCLRNERGRQLKRLLFLRFWIVGLLFELFSLRQNALSGRLVANLTERRLLPFRPNKQTSSEPVGMSQGAQQRKSTPLLDHLVGAREHSPWNNTRPSASAALRLIAISNFVGCMTGRSADLCPSESRRHDRRRAGPSQRNSDHGGTI